jgi:hypothetical protein
MPDIICRPGPTIPKPPYGFGTGHFRTLSDARAFAAVVAERDGVGNIYRVRPPASNHVGPFYVSYSRPDQVHDDFIERVAI